MNLYELIKRNSFRGLAMNLLRSFLDQVGGVCLYPNMQPEPLDPPLLAAGQLSLCSISPAVGVAIDNAQPLCLHTFLRAVPATCRCGYTVQHSAAVCGPLAACTGYSLPD